MTDIIKEQQNKADANKRNPLLLHHGLPNALIAINKVLDYGAQKYEAHGWKNVAPDRYDAAARRHQTYRDLGEVKDIESGLPHLAHEATNLLFQLEQYCIENNTDPRAWLFNEPPQEHKNSKT